MAALGFRPLMEASEEVRPPALNPDAARSTDRQTPNCAQLDLALGFCNSLARHTRAAASQAEPRRALRMELEARLGGSA